MAWILAALAVVSPGLSYAASTTLSWIAPTRLTDGSPYENPGGYRVFWGCEQSGVYPNTLRLDDPSLTSYVLDGLPDGTTCYFALTAFDTAGVESVLSDEATKTFAVEPVADPTEGPVITWGPVMAIQDANPVDFDGSVYFQSTDVPNLSNTIVGLTLIVGFNQPPGASRVSVANVSDGANNRLTIELNSPDGLTGEYTIIITADNGPGGPTSFSTQTADTDTGEHVFAVRFNGLADWYTSLNGSAVQQFTGALEGAMQVVLDTASFGSQDGFAPFTGSGAYYAIVDALLTDQQMADVTSGTTTVNTLSNLVFLMGFEGTSPVEYSGSGATISGPLGGGSVSVSTDDYSALGWPPPAGGGAAFNAVPNLYQYYVVNR